MLSNSVKDKDANGSIKYNILNIDPIEDLKGSSLEKELENKVRDKRESMRGGKEEGFFINLMPEHLLDSPEFIEMWWDWIKYRKEIRKKVTPTAAKRQFALLSKFSPDVATAMIDRSIVGSWQGIFELPKGHPLLENSNLADPGMKQGDTLRSIR